MILFSYVSVHWSSVHWSARTSHAITSNARTLCRLGLLSGSQKRLAKREFAAELALLASLLARYLLYNCLLRDGLVWWYDLALVPQVLPWGIVTEIGACLTAFPHRYPHTRIRTLHCGERLQENQRTAAWQWRCRVSYLTCFKVCRDA